MLRILKSVPRTIYQTFEDDGVATDPTPATVTVTVTRDDGTVLVAALPATRVSAGKFGYTLTPAQTALLDTLTLTWESPNLGTLTNTAEIVGGFLCTISEARALLPLSDPVKYTTNAIVAERTRVEQALENACGVAFVQRYRREKVSGRTTRTAHVVLQRPRVTAIRSVKLDGIAVSASELAAIVPSRAGVIYNPSGWAAGHGNYDIAYEHGYTAADEVGEANQAALMLLRNWLVKGPIDDRTTQYANEHGQFTMSTPGRGGSRFGIPVVDAFVDAHQLHASVA